MRLCFAVFYFSSYLDIIVFMARVRSMRRSDVDGEPRTQLNVLIPVSKHRDLKSLAAQEGMSMATMLCEWIDDHTESRKKEG